MPLIQIGHENHRGNLLHQRPVAGLDIRPDARPRGHRAGARVAKEHAGQFGRIASASGGVTAPSIHDGSVRLGLWLERQLGSLIQRRLREAAQRVNRAAVSHHRARRQQRAGRLVHERHELVGKPGHGAADADAAHVRAAADSAHPAALAHVALHHRAPASQLHDAWLAIRTLRRIPPARNSRRGRSLRAPSGRTARWGAARRRAESSARGRRPCAAGRAASRVMLSGCTGQPGMQTIGMPAVDFHSQPR